jgi:hypothetical protein
MLCMQREKQRQSFKFKTRAGDLKISKLSLIGRERESLGARSIRRFHMSPKAKLKKIAKNHFASFLLYY